ncbi:DUF2336 domain-containing protein [Bradyrhizobium guangdongense]|uniref:DUF2336 domain-containing protein n=1 Tax=Bradyrhizobium guangdongense TaxID=1325090 RepID=A0A410V6M3_9BRAD|nr:DUF2336 domain-containing protein [Bradyrhizobium guangdongense]QAU39270.1 hypothetical protein X265_17605 [Bradyrhizobium guangdongense]QOZ60329.1 hypothetical protein XH86_17610 [Bradyrhizobium guangdongense]GGI27190.1 hypothetical protein GCM10010987_43150 [Bradyrhizobium guangdongense]
MMANSPADSLVELEDAVAACPPERCARILEGVVNLLSANRDRPQHLLAGVADRVLLRLTERVTAGALIQLSTALAALAVAPPETLRRLAMHDDPDVACPVLHKSQALPTADLVSVAASCGERHQRAIAARECIEPEVTETLIKRGERICLALIKNPGTKFSETAYATLIATADQDGEIAKALALRPDTPDLVVRKLLSTSSCTAAPAKPDAASVSPAQDALPALRNRPSSTDYAKARPEIVALNRIGKLGDSTVNRFAIRGETANLFTALSVLSGAPVEIIEQVMSDDDCEGLVMACRASRLNWATTLAILSNRSSARLSFAQRERAQLMFETLLLSTSQWTVRWGEIAASAGTRDRTAAMGTSR